MKRQNKQEPQVLKEFLSFGQIFGLSFMQSILGGGGQPYDPEFEEFLKNQEELGRSDIIDKIRDMEQEELQNPETRAWLNKAMNSMPDEIQDAAAEQFAIEAGEQVNDFQTQLGTLGVAIKEGVVKIEDVAKKIGVRDAGELKKVYAKYAGASLKQLVVLWQSFSEALQKTASDKGDAKIHPKTLETMNLDFDVSQFSEFLAESRVRVLFEAEEAEGEPEHWALEFLKTSGIEASLVKLKEELDLLKGFATDEQNIFGIGTQVAKGFVVKMEKTFGAMMTAMKKRFPNEVAKIAHGAIGKGGKRRGARSAQDAASMSREERIEATGHIIASLEKAIKAGDKAKVQGLIPQLKAFAPDKVLKHVAKKYPQLNLKEHLKKQTFYESFGDFS